jgi:hypothetical protein
MFKFLLLIFGILIVSTAFAQFTKDNITDYLIKYLDQSIKNKNELI